MTEAATARRPRPPRVGAPAPNAILIDGVGEEVRLAALWQASPRALVVVFLRHFG